MPIVQCDRGPGQVSHTDWPSPASEQHNDRGAHTRTKTLPVFLVGWRVLGSGPTLCGRCVNRTTVWQNTAEGAHTIKAQMPRPRTKRTKQGRCCIESTLTTNRTSAAAAFSFKRMWLLVNSWDLPHIYAIFSFWFGKKINSCSIRLEQK